MTSVAAIVARAARRATRLALLEGAAVGAAAALFVAAAAAASGEGVAAAAAAVGGALAFATWVLERRVAGRALARRLDRALGRGGALITAFDWEREPARGALGAALARAEVRAASPERVRAALRPLGAVAAAPLVAAALLAAALESRPPTGPALALGAALPGSAPADLDDDEVGAELAPDAPGAAERAPGEGPTPAPEPTEEPGAAPPVGADGGDLEPDREAAGRTRERSAPSAAEVADAPSAVEPEATGLAPGAGDRTMSGRSAGPGPAAAGTGSASAASPVDPPTASEAPPREAPGEGGSLAGRWWPERYDRLVALWVEDRRARNP